MKILVYETKGGTLRLTKDSRRLIRKHAEQRDLNVVFAADHDEAVREIGDAEILFGYITPNMLREAKELRWVQAPMASFGVSSGEYYIFPGLAESDIILTNMSGIYSDVIATHVFAYITGFARDFPKIIRNQTKHVWSRDVKAANLRGMTLGIVGLGSIGKEVARLGAAFGMRVVAVEPRPQEVPQFVERVWHPEHLSRLMSESDFIVLCLPDAPSTVNLVGAKEIEAMRQTSYLINIGRGKTLDLDALTEVLRKHRIAGAGLDVFPPGYEPLPSEHPLWTMDNVVITPHCAGEGTPYERKVDVFLENLDRYMRGQALLNVVDKKSMLLTGPSYSTPP